MFLKPSYSAYAEPTRPSQSDLIHHLLCLPTPAITYHAGEDLAALYPDKTIFYTTDRDFDPLGYAEAGLCALMPSAQLYAQFATYWDRERELVCQTPSNAWLCVEWQSQRLDLLRLGCGRDLHYWLLADSRELAEQFFAAVCRWSTAICQDQEILVFEHGHWDKSRQLSQAIRQASLENLILPEQLKRELHEDLAQFFEARELYERYGVPWKRGVILIGPPGNGKTHAIKALANTLGKPCLYVKSLGSERHNEHHTIHEVFSRARQAAPCMLVFEDIESLITACNRSFFLNELDGFAQNQGVLALATSNYPERLDPAIINRPSRFDRKYHFALPDAGQRRAYLAHWSERQSAELWLSPEGIARAAEQSEGFSFAYLKELLLSTLMAWVRARQPGSMDRLVVEQLALLRSQMSNAKGAK